MNIFSFFLCLRISTDRDLSIRAIKSYIMRCTSSDIAPRRVFLQLHSLLHTTICVWSIQKISFKPLSDSTINFSLENWYKNSFKPFCDPRSRRPLLQLHSLASYYQVTTTNFSHRLFWRSISQSIFDKKISTNIWLKASQRGRSFKLLKWFLVSLVVYLFALQ